LNDLVNQNRIKVVSVYSRSKKSAEETKAKLVPNEHVEIFSGDDLDIILNNKDVDAVIICLPIDVQPDIISRALQAGKHILSEKPVSPIRKLATS